MGDPSNCHSNDEELKSVEVLIVIVSPPLQKTVPELEMFTVSFVNN